MLDNEVFGHVFLELFLWLPLAQHHKVVTCLNTETPHSVDRYRQDERIPAKKPISVMASSHGASKHSAAYFVP